MDSKLRVVSLFCGCGGAEVGLLGNFEYLGHHYRSLPYEIVFALDIDKKAVETYNLNFKEKAVQKAIENVELSEIPDHDVLIGGFPCQSFSTVNPTKDPFDERGQLYKQMGRILKVRQPKAFIAENVMGMLYLKKGEIFRRVLEEFSSAGYNLVYSLLNAADYGVPQTRKRVFIVGIRNDLDRRFEFPLPTNSEKEGLFRKRWVGLGSVIENLIPKDPKYYFSKKAVEGMKRAKKNMKRGLYQDLDKPCLTITSHLAKVSLNSRDPVLLVNRGKELYRRFTPQEAAAIQSFPKEFKFAGSELDSYRQIGNAIPPVLMWHLASSLHKQIADG